MLLKDQNHHRVEMVCREAWALLREAAGKDHPRVGIGLAHFLALYVRQGRHREAWEAVASMLKILMTCEGRTCNVRDFASVSAFYRPQKLLPAVGISGNILTTVASLKYAEVDLVDVVVGVQIGVFAPGLERHGRTGLIGAGGKHGQVSQVDIAVAIQITRHLRRAAQRIDKDTVDGVRAVVPTIHDTVGIPINIRNHYCPAITRITATG